MSDRYTQRGTAQWRYSARPQHAEVLADGNARARWWAEALQALLSSLGRHSRLERASVTTGEQGEDAFELALRGDADLRSLVDYVAARQDFCALWLDATLQAVSPEGEDIALDYALTLDVVVEQTDDQQPVLSGEFPFDLTLALNADLYVEATFRGDGDNRALARANRERLRALLVALEHTPGVARSGYESSVYRGQITRDGFVDLRDYRAAQRAQGLLVIERSADGVEVVRVRRFELAGPTLEVHYETLLAIDAAMARGLILQALIEGPSGDSFRGRFERVSYRDLQSGASLETLARR